MQTTFIYVILTGVLCLAASQPASAQLVLGQPGAIRGLFGGSAAPDPDRASQRFTVVGDVSGGQDRFPVESVLPAVPGPVSLHNNATTATGTASYIAGRVGRLFEATGGGFLNRETYNQSQLHGANVSARGSVGRRAGVSGFASASYQPLGIQNTLAVGSPVVTAVNDPGVDVSSQSLVGPPNGVFAQKWLSTQVGGNVFRNWSPRRRFDGGVTAWQWRPIEGRGLESQSQRLSGIETDRLTERASIRYQYRFERNAQTGIDALASHSRLHGPELGYRYTRRLSPFRSLTFDVLGGVTYAVFYAQLRAGRATVLPTATASFQYNLSRRWVFGVNAGQDVAILNVFSNQPFRTTQAGAQVSGLIARRLNLFVSTAYTHGEGAIDQSGSFTAVAQTLRVQYGLATWCGAFASYSYYQQDLNQLRTPAASGIQSDFGRHAARVGVTFWVPMYGRF